MMIALNGISVAQFFAIWWLCFSIILCKKNMEPKIFFLAILWNFPHKIWSWCKHYCLTHDFKSFICTNRKTALIIIMNHEQTIKLVSSSRITLEIDHEHRLKKIPNIIFLYWFALVCAYGASRMRHAHKHLNGDNKKNVDRWNSFFSSNI